LETQDDKQCQEWKKKLMDLQTEYNIKWDLPLSDIDTTSAFTNGKLGGWFNKKGKGGPLVNDYKMRYCQYAQDSNEIEYFASLRNGVPKTLKGSVEMHGGFDVSREGSTLFILTTEGKRGKTSQRKWKLIACEEDGRTNSAGAQTSGSPEDMEKLAERARVWEAVLLEKRKGKEEDASLSPTPTASGEKKAPARPAPPPGRPPPPSTSSKEPLPKEDADTEDEDEDEDEGKDNEGDESDDESEDEALPTYNEASQDAPDTEPIATEPTPTEETTTPEQTETETPPTTTETEAPKKTPTPAPRAPAPTRPAPSPRKEEPKEEPQEESKEEAVDPNAI